MKTRILLVDDDPNIRQLVNLYLEKEGFEVIMADRGDEAVRLFRQSPPNLILLDLSGAHMSPCNDMESNTPMPVTVECSDTG